jgi:hypothetical protein
VIIAVLLGTWFVLSTSLFLRPLSVTYNFQERVFVFTRDLRWLGPTTVSFNHTLYRPNGEVCVAHGRRVFEPGVGIDSLPVPESLTSCFNDPNTTYYLSWSILVWGVIPLRPLVDVYEPMRAVRPVARHLKD